MARIQLLDDNLINKIAAGEVVERPASVVKELVENSLDAGATKITVELQEGGRKRILISDNGSGMSAADAAKSLLRHATSKIQTAEDLFNLNTMGFRGEALASISSVCRFTLMTCEQGSSEGVRLQADGGAPLASTPWQSSGGTTIICDDIFYNVPVRQKFLKSAQSEYGAVMEFMQAACLANPGVDFTLIHNSKEVLRAAAVTNDSNAQSESAIRGRFAQVMKGDAGLGMIFTKAASPWANLTALVSAPGVERGAAKDMFLFVNGRWIKDKSLRFAVLRGYHSHLLRGRYPVVAVFLTLDSGLVDANVHPAKTEVRLQYANEIHSMVASAVRDALRRGDWAAHASHPSLAGSGLGVSSAGSLREEKSDIDGLVQRSQATARWRDVTPEFSTAISYVAPKSGKGSGGWTSPSAPVTGTMNGFFERLSEPSVAATSPAMSATQSIPWRELQYFGSIADCYLLFSHGDRKSGSRLLAVDQHAFHERVLYERLARNEDLLKSSQTLLVPECVVLDAGAAGVIAELKPQLESNGFRIELIDETTIEVRAVPVLLAKSDLVRLFESLAQQDASALPLDSNIGLTHDILATMACHGAVRAGEQLGENELKMLIAESDDVDFYHNCPHGRRVFRWWDEAQIARWFDR